MDAKHGWEVTGLRRVRDEDDGPTGDPAVDEAFDGLGATWDFWQNVFSRDSIDDENMPLRGVVHFGEEYPNAFWDGRRMVFGDGDGEIFLRFTKSLDVIGHELGHGVIEDEAGARVLRPVRRAERALRRRRRRHGQAVQARPDRRPGRLADRRRPARRRVRRRRAALDEGPGDRLRRRRAGQGPAARPLARLRAHVRGQRRRPHQLGDRQQGLLPARHQPRRQVLARARATSGTTRCAARCSPPPPPSASSPASPTAPRASASAPARTRPRRCARRGPRSACAGNEDRGPPAGRVRGPPPPAARGRDRGPRARARRASWRSWRPPCPPAARRAAGRT